jgi:hypothetical protein
LVTWNSHQITYSCNVIIFSPILWRDDNIGKI